MVDFKKALEAGLAANADATAKRKEISSVVSDLSQQLSSATNGVVGVKLRDSVREKVRHLSNIVATITGDTQEITRVKYTALSAERLVEPVALAELAEVELEPTGYPVLVTSSGVNAYAHDRESLERILAGLLEHPDTGGKIQHLLNMKART